MPENNNDLQRMQLDAERRIREMQRRSQNALHGNDRPPVPNYSTSGQMRHNRQADCKSDRENGAKQNQPSNRNKVSNQAQGNPQNNGQRQDFPFNAQQKSGFLSRFKGLDILKIFNFQNLHIDNDVLIIIALIFLLSTEETDELLLMALIYIML